MKEKQYISTLLLVAFFTVTAIGLSSSSSSEFLRFVPYVFVVSSLVLLANNRHQNAQHYFFYVLVLVLTYIIHLTLHLLDIQELNPNYRTKSGVQLFGVPLIIPLIWFYLINTVNGVLRKLDTSDWLKALVGALMVVVMDLFLEAQAPKFEFWSWPGGTIPIENYLWWFFISFGFLFASFRLNIRNHTFTSVAGYVLLLLFFVASDTMAL